MNDIWLPGATIPVRVLMYDGATAQTGLTVYCSIERLADGWYWTGAAWQAAYQALTMTEQAGDAHLAGVYQYDFVSPATAGAFDWRVTYDGAIKRAFAGRITTDALAAAVIAELNAAMPELTGLISVTPTIKQALMFFVMHLRNVLSSGGNPGSEYMKIRNDAGTVIMKAIEAWEPATLTYTKQKFTAGP